MKILVLLLTLTSLSFATEKLKVGGQLPKLKAKNQEGKELTLQPTKESKFLILFTFPRALTPGWTAQVCSVRDAFEKLKAHKVTIYGMSSEDVATQKKFHEKHKLPYDLLSDPKGELAKKLGLSVHMDKFISRRAMIFKDGKLIWRSKKGATADQGEQLLKQLKTLSQETTTTSK